VISISRMMAFGIFVNVIKTVSGHNLNPKSIARYDKTIDIVSHMASQNAARNSDGLH